MEAFDVIFAEFCSWQSRKLLS